MKVGLGQINTTIGDFEGNLQKILDYYRKAVAAKADLVLFPELALCGYPPRDLLLKSSFVNSTLKALDTLAPQISGPPIIVGYVDRNEGVGRPLRNSAAVIQNGKITHRIHKTLLPTYDVFDEDRYFEPASSNQAIELCGRKVGLTICEDIWNDEDFWPSRLYRQDPVKSLKTQGIDLLLNISASPWNLNKEKVRFQMLETIARNDNLPVLYCNSVGGNDELIFDGHSFAFKVGGTLIAQGKSFAEDLLIVDLDQPKTSPALESDDCHNLFRALSLGLKDYVHKCGFKSVVLGLSGGIDSALTACIAVAALGKENVLGVAMPSRYSSEGSVSDAKKIAENLGIGFEIIPIQPQVEGFQEALSKVFAGRPEDTTEENLQSRIRGVTLMAISNKFGCMLITTGNKSELATGYCTLYGDMCGGLAVISDLSKTQVYDLSRWINDHAESTGLIKTVIPPDSITKPPSAELKPNQFDQDTLPPYPVLDGILSGYVERYESAKQIAEKGFDPKLVNDLVRKIDFNEYKRRQAAPGLKVTSKAFGVGRRIPIAHRYRESAS
jgi:NAD+ synthase (glutamine-hydrolysing)